MSVFQVMQERINAEGYLDEETGERHRFKNVPVLNLIQASFACVAGWVLLAVTGAKRSVPLADFFVVSVTTTAASPFGYYALNYIDYPFFALGKACKLIPVMVMSIFMNKARYSAAEYAAVGLITLGVAVFSIKTDAELKKSYADSLVGLGFIMVNLFMDGFTNAAQDKMNRSHSKPISSYTYMFSLNAWAVVFLGSFLLVDHFVLSVGGVSFAMRALEFYHRFPQVAWDVVYFAALGSTGQIFIFYTIREFGSLVNTTVCITRKFLTIVISVFLYNHPMTFVKWTGVAAVFSGLGVQVWTKYQKQRAVHATVDPKKIQ